VNGKRENRIDKIVTDLLRGRRLKLRGGDAEEKEAITMAARLAGARHGPERMSPAFRRNLAAALEQTSREGSITRRMALVAGLGLAAGAATGGLLEKRFEPASVPPSAGRPIEPVNGVWTDVASLDDLAEGEGRQVSAGGVGAFVFRRGDTVTAVSSICSHLPCELWWDDALHMLNCPCHPVSFTAEGQARSTYSPLPDLNTVHARVTSDRRVEVLGTD
jgi:nitrite reductase/ring-hydroxylating ferredoxin subunit